MLNEKIIIGMFVVSALISGILVFLLFKITKLLKTTQNETYFDIKNMFNSAEENVIKLVGAAKKEQDFLINITSINTNKNIQSFTTNVENRLVLFSSNFDHNLLKIKESLKTHDSKVLSSFEEIHKNLNSYLELIEKHQLSVKQQNSLLLQINPQIEIITKQIAVQVTLQEKNNLLIVDNQNIIEQQNKYLKIKCLEKDNHIKKLEQMLTRKNQKLSKMEEQKNEN